MKSRFNILPIAFAMGISSLAAETIEIHPDLALAASKVDTGAPFFELSLVDGHIEKLLPYADLISGLMGGDDDYPEMDIRGWLESSGTLSLKAIAKSSLQQGDSWLNKTYYVNPGGMDVLGGAQGEFDVFRICPKGTDVAVQLRLDLSQSPEMMEALEDIGSIGGDPAAEPAKEIDPLNRSNVDILLGVRFDLDKPQEKSGIPELKDYVVRVKGLVWLWEKIGDDFISENYGEAQPEVERAEAGGVVRYSPSKESFAADPHLPTIVVDAASDTIWLSNSGELLAMSRQGGEGLADDPDFQSTWIGMPKSGDLMAYVSPDLVRAGAGFIADIAGDLTGSQSGSGEGAGDAGLLIKELVKSLTDSKSGLGYSISKDEDGGLTVSRLPVPSKYLESALSSYGILASLLPLVQESDDIDLDMELSVDEDTELLDVLAEGRRNLRIARESGMAKEDIERMEALFNNLEEQLEDGENPGNNPADDDSHEETLRRSLDNIRLVKELGADEETIKSLEEMHKSLEKSINDLRGTASPQGKD